MNPTKTYGKILLYASRTKEPLRSRRKRENGRPFSVAWPCTRLTMERLQDGNRRIRTGEMTKKSKVHTVLG